MAIKNLLVAYNGSNTSDAALHNAMLMQRKYDAHVTGLLVQGEPHMIGRGLPWMPESIRNSIATAAAEAADRLKARFGGATSGAPADRIHWIDSRGESNATVAEYGRLFDLTILGAYEEMGAKEHLELHPDRIALISGRPVLVFPAGHLAKEIVEHAVLAWDGSRAAARAMNDAMQILETKALVTIVTVGKARPEASPPGIDVETALARHGVRTERVTLKEGRSIARTILDHCAECGAGLLVMGAYEHSKFREDFLGGVTHTVLREAQLPVFLSH